MSRQLQLQLRRAQLRRPRGHVRRVPPLARHQLQPNRRAEALRLPALCLRAQHHHEPGHLQARQQLGGGRRLRGPPRPWERAPGDHLPVQFPGASGAGRPGRSAAGTQQHARIQLSVHDSGARFFSDCLFI